MSKNVTSDLAAEVETTGGNYPVWVGWGILDDIGNRTKEYLSPSCVYIITDESILEHARKVQISMEKSGIASHMYIVPPGESSKTLETVQQIYSWLAGRKAERRHLIVAVGGGVIGDMAGFVAATYLRGMPFVQVPTTLLAMMDASIGGKVAVDLPQGKNLVGAFYQPKFVLSDVETLVSLPERELNSGWAEAIKHGLILDQDLLGIFENRVNEVRSLDRDIATEIIRKSVAIKANVVSRDERETLGIRILLNYGHTIGHAIESSTGYTKYLHGEAVSIGMMAAAKIGQFVGVLREEEVIRQEDVLKAYGLPVRAQGLDAKKIIEATTSDKKTSDGIVNWVLLKGLGNAVTNNEIPINYVLDAVNFVIKDVQPSETDGKD
jgi:3-dehydroquinate synthase